MIGWSGLDMIWQDSSFGLHCVGKISYTAQYCALLGRALAGHMYQLFQAAVWTVTVGTLGQFHVHIDVQLSDVVELYAACSNVTHFNLALEMLLGVLAGTCSMTRIP